MSAAATTLSPTGPNRAPLLTWHIPVSKSLFALAVFLPLSLLLGVFVGTAGRYVLLGSMTMDIRVIFLGTVASALALWMLALLTETWIIAGAALFVRTAHASVGLDEFDHFQLKTPIRLDSVEILIIHGSPRLPRTAITLKAYSPIHLRFPSLLNIRRMLGLSDAGRAFTFMPGLLSGEMGAALTTALIRVVRLHGGQVLYLR